MFVLSLAMGWSLKTTLRKLAPSFSIPLCPPLASVRIRFGDQLKKSLLYVTRGEKQVVKEEQRLIWTLSLLQLCLPPSYQADK